MRRFVLPQSFQVPLVVGSRVKLPEGIVHHLRVLRLASGAEIVLATGAATFSARIEADGFVEICSEQVGLAAPFRLTLVQALTRTGKLDETVRVACEVGLDVIQFVHCERSVTELVANNVAKRLERWTRIAEEAARQAETSVPEILAPLSWDAWKKSIAGTERHIIATDARVGVALPATLRERDVAIVVGPEGGLSPEEIAELTSLRSRFVSFPTGVLRTEHAGPIALALVRQALFSVR